jgi:hypothetical protein
MIRTLEELIALFRRYPPDHPATFGIRNPHSYRGDYADLAVEPVDEPSTAGAWAEVLEEALDAEYQGYKGGHYTMDGHVNVYLANYGDLGEALGGYLVRAVLGGAPPQGAAAYLVTALAVDLEDHGPAEVRRRLENLPVRILALTRYDVGAWSDEHPLNQESTAVQTWLHTHAVRLEEPVA